MKNRFGRRYISDKELLDYAQDLDLADQPQARLLEFMEKHGLILPVARIRFPSEIACRWHKDRYPTAQMPGAVEGDTPRLEAADILFGAVFNNEWRKSEVYGERPHPLDDIAPEHQEFIQSDFDKSSFVPWKDLRSVIEIDNGKEIVDAGQNTRTLYHYWQVFALAAFLRSGVTILYDLSDDALFHELFALKIEDASRGKLYGSINLEARHELNAILERRNLFDAVAYFEAYRHNALQKHVHKYDRKTRRLPTVLSREYRKREKEIARETLKRFNIKPRHVLEFIKFQCGLWAEAKRYSPENVADEYRRNIDSTIDLYRIVSRDSFADVVMKVGNAGGYFKPILKVIFPDWMEEQRDLAERSLKSWMIPSMAALPPPFAISEKDVEEFCAWVEKQGLVQLYWHFKRLMDIGFADHPIARSATAAEAVGFANTVELLANAVVKARTKKTPRDTLFPKLQTIFKTASPSVAALLEYHWKLTGTKKSTLRKRIAQIDRLKKGGTEAPVVRALLKFVVIRNEGSHLGLIGFDRQEIYELLEALIQACLVIWKAR